MAFGPHSRLGQPAALASDCPKFLIRDQVLSSACRWHSSLRVHEGTIDRADLHNSAVFFQLSIEQLYRWWLRA
jgi:hypothetical protein